MKKIFNQWYARETHGVALVYAPRRDAQMLKIVLTVTLTLHRFEIHGVH
jgi:hypothetical protein